MPAARRIFLLSVLCVLAWALVQGPPPSPPPPPKPPEITLVAVGDILLGRKLAIEMDDSGDYSLPFALTGDLLAASITFGNFESAFCEKPPWPTTGMVFRIRPEAIESLRSGGFDVVSIANNHAGDGGDACIRFTFEHLRAYGIASAGAGPTYDDAHAPAIVERHGVKFAFLAYTYAERNDQPGIPGKSPRPVIAGRNIKNVQRDVEAARRLADVVIVSLHDGAEYLQRVARETREFARAAIDAGATAVLGHHPHVPQRVEQYKQGWIFYSLGNFVFQQNTPPAVKHALLARLTFTGATLRKVEAIPAVIENYARPRPATPEESAAILASIGLSQSVLWSAAAP